MKAYDEIAKKERLKGREWDGTIDDKIAASYSGLSRELDNYRNRYQDLKDNLTSKELITREQARLDDKYAQIGEQSFENVQARDKFIKEIEQDYANIYQTKKPRDIGEYKVQNKNTKSISSETGLLPEEKSSKETWIS